MKKWYLKKIFVLPIVCIIVFILVGETAESGGGGGILLLFFVGLIFWVVRKLKKSRNRAEYSIVATFDDMGNNARDAVRAQQFHEQRKQDLEGMETVYLDLETTGLDPLNDEILEISIINDDGDILVNSLVRPLNRKRWPKAQEIHGISYAMVKNAPTLEELKPKIQAAVKGKHIVIYNKNFDLKFLPFLKYHPARYKSCCMERYAQYKQPSVYGRKYSKLIDAASETGYEWQGDAHRALADTFATRHLWQWLNEKNAQLT